MELPKVKSIVRRDRPGRGPLVVGSDDYVIRCFNGHDIVFLNGKVTSKYWN